MHNQQHPSSNSREINPVERGVRSNEVPMPEQRTGDLPPSFNDASNDMQAGGRDTEETGKWDNDTR